MVRKIANNIALIAVFGFVALGRIYLVPPEGLQIAGAALAAEVVILTLAFSIATVLNIRLLVPRLLLRNRFAAYLLLLLGFAIIFTGIAVGFERLLIDYYHLLPGKYWYFSEESILPFELLSSVTVYFISEAGTAVFIFLRLWNRSGERVRDLNEQNARNELEKTRTQIDAETLFEALDNAAAHVEESPSEVSGQLMQLSKSLRKQLYESGLSRTAAQPHPEKAEHGLNLWSLPMNILVDKRYRALRHLLMVAVFIFVLSSNLDRSWDSVLVGLSALLIYLALIYFSIYVLFPKLRMRNKVGVYFLSVTLSVLVIALHMQESHFMEIYGPVSAWMLALYTASNIIMISFPVVSVNALLLFQYWVRNERHIAELEAARLRSELDQLQNQVNPHFLFNMLNNIIVLAKKNPREAAGVLHKLSDMLKYQFRGFAKQTIRLGDDIRFLADYLNLEKLRRDNFEFSITADGGVEEISLPPLLFIPFVENAVKHNNDNRNLSFVRLRFEEEGSHLHFVCINSKPLRPLRKDEAGGLGLPNVRRRLGLLYGNRHRLEITENDTTYTVHLSIELTTKM